MAERRMFAKTIIDSDAFIDMPVTARLLYYDLGMRADDDGFVNSPKKIMRMIGASEDDMRILVTRKFIIPFESGVVVIKHWLIHNYIRKDTYKETPYKNEKSLLGLDENSSYYVTDSSQVRDRYVTDSSQVRVLPVIEPSTQDRIGKDSIGKVSSCSKTNSQPAAPETSPTFVDELITKWNSLECTQNVGPISYMSRRDEELRKCLLAFGPDEVMRSIDKIAGSKWLSRKKNISWDSYMNVDAMQKLLGGEYDEVYEKEVKRDIGQIWDFKIAPDD